MMSVIVPISVKYEFKNEGHVAKVDRKADYTMSWEGIGGPTESKKRRWNISSTKKV